MIALTNNNNDSKSNAYNVMITLTNTDSGKKVVIIM